jgi:hypothetical protein
MYLRYYDADRFPFPQGINGPWSAFPGSPALANPPLALGFYRPNQAISRGVYGRRLSGLGQIEVDPTLLALGIGALALGMFLFGKKKSGKRRRRNVAAGFHDEDGVFHPIRASYDYSAKRAGESRSRKRRKRR